MPYRKIIFKIGEYYHIYNRGNNRQNIFFERDNYLYFLRQIRRYLVAETLEIIAYCLMPNHYHLLVCLKNNNISNAMQAFTLSYTKAINNRYQRTGSLFEGRFQAIHINRDEYLLHLFQYIHLNPVKADFVKHPKNWEFSSYQDYIGLRKGTLPNISILQKQFNCIDEYQKFIQLNSKCFLTKIQHLMFDE